jgi:hypothetical protein
MTTHPLEIPLCDFLDEFDWDPYEVRDLIKTTRRCFGEDALPVGYEAEQFFVMEAV